MKYRFIFERHAPYSVLHQCRVLSVSRAGYYQWRAGYYQWRAGYYQWRKGEIPRRQKENYALMLRARHHFRKFRGRYGSPRLTRVLQQEGLRCSHNRVARVMRQDGLQARSGRPRRCVTTRSDHTKASPNLLNRNFTAALPNTKLTSDITYVRVEETRNGWLYVATVMDLCTRKIVGLAMRDDLTDQLAIDALEQALLRQPIEVGALLHSDRGVQYSSQRYRALLATHGLVQSMSRKGNCWDNAPMESFFKTMKTEINYPAQERKDFQTEQEARRAIFEYVEVFYNRQRMHSTLNYQSPETFEETINQSRSFLNPLSTKTG